MPTTTKRRSSGTKAAALATAARTFPTLPTVKVVGVRFTETDRYDRCRNALKVYHYFTDLDLAPGDLAVVCANDRYCVVEVATVCHGGSPQASKWILDKVDLETARARQERAKRAQEAKRILAEAQAAMNQQMLLELVLPTLPADQQKFVVDALGLPPPTSRRRRSQARGAT